MEHPAHCLVKACGPLRCDQSRLPWSVCRREVQVGAQATWMSEELEVASWSVSASDLFKKAESHSHASLAPPDQSCQNHPLMPTRVGTSSGACVGLAAFD
eukprot:3358168-Rhodomonas_salina.1